MSELDDLARDAAPAPNHSVRVAAYAIAIARKMGLQKDEISVIARGAYLHDIGKMAIPVDAYRSSPLAVIIEQLYQRGRLTLK